MTVSPNNDIELLDLCKQVYKATGWEMDSWKDFQFPLYTSDYLFEEIDRRIGEYRVLHVYSMFDIETYESYCKANVGTPGSINISTDRTDTILKALLKLTLALHEAGVLHD